MTTQTELFTTTYAPITGKVGFIVGRATQVTESVELGAATNQTDEILRYLQSGKSITPLEALRLFGCFRLGARIWNLKGRGYDIRTEMVEINGRRVARYSMDAPGKLMANKYLAARKRGK